MTENKFEGVGSQYTNRNNFENDNSPDSDPGQTHTYKLIIPYYTGDIGDGGPNNQRKLPFPDEVISWLCPAIHINDQIYNGAPLLNKNETVSVTVEVSN